MLLFTKCEKCKKEIRIKSHASTRTDLEMERGDLFRLKCKECGCVQDKTVKDVRAKQNNAIVLGGVGVSMVAAVLLWIYFGAIAVITFVIPIIIWKQQSNSVHAFNAYRRRV